MDSVLGLISDQDFKSLQRNSTVLIRQFRLPTQPFSSTLKLKFDVTMYSIVSLAMQMLIHHQALIMYALHYAAPSLEGL